MTAAVGLTMLPDAGTAVMSLVPEAALFAPSTTTITLNVPALFGMFTFLRPIVALFWTTPEFNGAVTDMLPLNRISLLMQPPPLDGMSVQLVRRRLEPWPPVKLTSQ